MFTNYLKWWDAHPWVLLVVLGAAVLLFAAIIWKTNGSRN